LEPYAASLVAKSISKDAELKKDLRGLYEKAREICETAVDRIDFESYLAIDLGLNEIFLKASGETLFREVLRFVSDRSLRIRTFLEAVSKASPDRMIHVITKEHLGIIEALLNEIPGEAQANVHKHLNNGETRTLKAIRNKLNQVERLTLPNAKGIEKSAPNLKK
jgi:DNA-binding GntR family transcriptional regulator